MEINKATWSCPKEWKSQKNSTNVEKFKTPIRAGTNCASHDRKLKVEESALPTNPAKGRDGKLKIRIQAIQAINQMEG